MRETYKVTITEKAYRTTDVHVRADSKQKAEDAVKQRYEMDELDLDRSEFELDEFFIDSVEALEKSDG